MRNDFRRRYPKRFEVAIWDASSLIGVSLGRPTYAGQHLRLDIIEARPRSLGPRSAVLPDVLLAYTVYAQMLDAKSIRIMNPINAEVRAYYERAGYRYVPKQDYLFMELT